MTFIKYIFLSTTFVLLASQVFEGHESTLNDGEIIKKAVQEWNAYGDFLAHCEGTVASHTKWYDQDGNIREERKTHSDTICDYPYAVFEFRLNDEKPRITGYNKDYTFYIRKEKEGPYTIRTVEELEKMQQSFSWKYRNWEEGGMQLLVPIDSKISAYAASLTSVSTPLPEIFTLPGFHVTSIENFGDSSVNKIRISFTFSPETNSPVEPVRKGSIDLLPDLGWMPVHTEMYLAGDVSDSVDTAPYLQICDYEYQTDYEKPLLKTEFAETKLHDKLLWNSTAEYDLKYVKHGKYPKKRFTLSYYGLPEPDFVEKKFTPFRVFMFVIGLGFILLSVYQLRRNWRRYQRNAE